MSEPRTIYRVGPRDGGKRLDRFLHERIPRLSRTWVQKAIVDRVTLSWAVAARPATKVRSGGEVRVGFTPIEETPLDVTIAVLGRGAGWLAVDKPSGIPVHPVNRARENTVIRMVRRQLDRESLRLVHRLDCETSGVLLIAEDSTTARALSMAFERGQVHKEYLAVVRGEFAESAGEIKIPIGPAEGSKVHTRLAPASDGKPSHTAWRVERRLSSNTLLRVFPKTGRRHQIRVHLESIGHPVLGDLLYGRSDEDFLDLVRGVRDARHDEGGPTRHLLHCARLVFPDPNGPGRIAVDAALPPEFVDRLDD